MKSSALFGIAYRTPLVSKVLVRVNSQADKRGELRLEYLRIQRERFGLG
jgi:hypothetical protein